MFIVANFLGALSIFFHAIINVYIWIVIISALITWVNPDPYNPIVRFLYSVTEPVFRAIRRRIPMTGVGIDFSPIIVIAGLYFLDYFLTNTLLDVATMLRR